MFGKVLGGVGLATVFSVAIALAQPSTFDEPAELPPASFKGQQYVDSRGCVFLRAGYGGKVTWVPRVSRDRTQMCGQPGGATEAAVAEDPATLPAVEAVAAPAVKVADVPRKKVKKAAAPAPAPVTPQGLRMACPSATPYLERLRVSSGETKLFCTRGDGTVEGASLPRLIDSGKVVAHVTGVTVQIPSNAPVVLPKGYEKAWKDDRLNPHRAKGTGAGAAAQDTVWTKDVPQAGVPGNAPVATVKGPVKTAAKASGGLFVQVGSFAVASNADGASGRLAALGFPVARANRHLNGKAVEVVFAGPFASSAEAQSALSAVRRAGFGDAFVVR
jgi:hypothetical protein